MTRWLRVLAIVAAPACGDNLGGLDPVPATLSAGPVTIDTATMTLTLGSQPALVQPGFLAIGTAREVVPTTYYDPRGHADVTLAAVDRPRGMDGDALVLEGGTRIRLGACPVPDCAVLDVDATAHRDAVQLRLALPRDADEPLYGTGDAGVRANVAGTVRAMQLQIDLESASSLNETHVPVPLVLWPRRGAGLFVADDRPGALDLGATDATRVTATFTLPARGAYRIYLYTADAPLELVRRYVALTGPPAVPPRWAFAPQQWRNVHDHTGQLLDDMAEMRARGIPGSAMWIDNPWQTGYNTFVIDEQRFANIDDAIAQLTAHGYKVVFWSTPYVGTTPVTAADRAEGAARGYFVTDEQGRAFDWPWQDGPGAMVDFTAPGATAWWRERIARVIARGAAGFKLDFGEELVPNIGGNIVTFELAAGDNSSHHNRYAHGYHEAYLGALPADDKYLITRAGAWGEQVVNPVIWPGDLDSDFSEHDVLAGGKRTVGGLPSAIARGLGLSVSGYPFYGSDIGGFRGFPTTEVLLRWAQYAALGTIMQLGGGGKSHNPWDATLFDAGADAIYRTYADLHMRLNPLLWTLALQAGRDGTPVTRPARFVYDCACDDAMFLLGDDLLVAPVITAGATTREVVLPPGRWVDAWTGVTSTGDGARAITVPAPLERLPLWYRADSVVPMFARAADTLLPATAPGVTSYADPARGGELRAIVSPSGDPPELAPLGAATLHDGAEILNFWPRLVVRGGTQYTVITVDVDARALAGALTTPAGVTADGAELPAAATIQELEACAPPGCWHFDATTRRLQARLHVANGASVAIVIR